MQGFPGDAARAGCRRELPRPRAGPRGYPRSGARGSAPPAPRHPHPAAEGLSDAQTHPASPRLYRPRPPLAAVSSQIVLPLQRGGVCQAETRLHGGGRCSRGQREPSPRAATGSGLSPPPPPPIVGGSLGAAPASPATRPAGTWHCPAERGDNGTTLPSPAAHARSLPGPRPAPYPRGSGAAVWRAAAAPGRGRGGVCVGPRGAQSAPCKHNRAAQVINYSLFQSIPPLGRPTAVASELQQIWGTRAQAKRAVLSRSRDGGFPAIFSGTCYHFAPFYARSPPPGASASCRLGSLPAAFL